MGKGKNYCNKCDTRHFPPTGQKCSILEEYHVSPMLAEQSSRKGKSKFSEPSSSKTSRKMAKGLQQVSDSDTDLSSVEASPVLQKNGAIKKKTVNRTTVASQVDTLEEEEEQGVQSQILKQLQLMNKRLGEVEQQVQAKDSRHKTKDLQKLSTPTCSNCDKSKGVCYSDSKVTSSDESDVPDISYLRSSKSIQKQVDCRLSQLERGAHLQGKCNSQKIKSKRGGVEVLVEKKIAWPHDVILGCSTKQRVTYDQLSLLQFVQGFIKNILDEGDNSIRESMLVHLADLMEDASDFSWPNAKAAHAVILCEMERGLLGWQDTNRLDRLRRAHAQKHVYTPRQIWSKNDVVKKPWFCKAFQQNSCQFEKDHEFNGKMQRHICAFCLNQGKQLHHSEKDCNNKKKASKNEVSAAHH